ncbi:MAG TPA: histidine--tRNA ligase [Actinomycetota bacterium]|nr:histidine--tRNA ligase [Actinomycetota bacterium]
MIDPRTVRAPRGTLDVLPPQSWRWQDVVRLGLDSFARAGYAPIETPAFEHTEVFERGVGEASEVVEKQMYTFRDRAGRSLTLRPEGTAPVVRAVLEHGLHRGPLPVKLSYASAMFRQERPQRGRHRQFVQLGIECIGTEAPLADAEVIEVGMRFLADAGVAPALAVNSVGHPDDTCRRGYLKVLVEFLEGNAERLAPEDRTRAATNPLRAFDSKAPATMAALERAPLISDHLCGECREHFDSVRAALDDAGVAHAVDPRLVRGLDYYSRTAFEISAAGLGSQDAVGGGGRYDGLAELLGGPRLPGIGFALGLERILLALARRSPQDPRTRVDVYVVALGGEAARTAFRVATSLRARGIGADLDLAGRGLKGQMKDAIRSGARRAVILGARELETGRATVKDLDSGEQVEVPLADIERSWEP